MHPIVSSFALLCAAGAALAAENVLIQIDAIKEGVPLSAPAVPEGIAGRAYFPTWNKDEAKKDKLIEARFAIPAKTWSEIGVRFTPEKDGRVVLSLRGPWKPKPGQPKEEKNPELQPVMVTYDQVTAEGAALANGDFEELDAKEPTRPKGWWLNPKGIAKLVSEPGAAKTGSNAVTAWLRDPAAQGLNVKAGVTVTIKAWAWSEVDPEAK